MNQLEKILGSGLYSGYIKTASGTFGSLVALFIFLIPGFENPTLMIFVISVCIVAGVPIADKFEKEYGKDPPQFTLDEFIGTWITFLFLPKKIWYLILAFLIWRALDIFKPFPARRLENINGGWGVILDDVAAGIYSFMAIQIIIYLLNRFIL
ncbi:MAG: phosphatidylglycerophosphatase A [Ignavibacteriales bacterium]|nr:phosphatidylglycerophosphatase A [Ignavibacteriales bacterium]